MKTNILSITTIVISTLLIISVLMQQKGSGLTQVFGGSGSYGYRTKRGIEKFLFRSTIILAIALVGLAIANLIIK